MPVISDTIIGGIAWEAFSKSFAFYNDKINNFVLRVYIAGKLRDLKQLEDVANNKIDDTAATIEAIILDTPENIKAIKNPKEKQEAFSKYIKKNVTIQNITTKNYFEKIDNVGTMNFY